MVATTRPLPGGTQDAISAQFTQPFYLVRAEFPAPYGSKTYSTGAQLVFGGKTYVGDSCAVAELSWDGDAVQSGKVELYNEDGAAAAMIIAAGISEVEAFLYIVYRRLNGTTTDPVLVARGTLTDSDIEPASVILTLEATSQNAERIPNRYVTKQEGFSFLPVPGAQIQWGDEVYIFEEDK